MPTNTNDSDESESEDKSQQEQYVDLNVDTNNTNEEEHSSVKKPLEQDAKMDKEKGDGDDSSGDDGAYMPMLPKKTKSEHPRRNQTNKQSGSDTSSGEIESATGGQGRGTEYDFPPNNRPVRAPGKTVYTNKSKENGTGSNQVGCERVNNQKNHDKSTPDRPIPKPRDKVPAQKAHANDKDGSPEKTEIQTPAHTPGSGNGVERGQHQTVFTFDQCKSPSPYDSPSVVKWIKAWHKALAEKDEASCYSVDIPKLEGINMEEITEGFRLVLNRDREQIMLIEEVHKLYRHVNLESEESGMSSQDRKKVWQKAEKKQKEMEKKEKKEKKRLQSSEPSTFYADDHENVKSALLEICKLQTIYSELLKMQKPGKKSAVEVAKVNCNCYEKINRLQLKLDEERQKVKDKDEVCRGLNSRCERQEKQIQRINMEKEAAISEKEIALQEKEAALTRLSEIASGRLRQDNPAITDLSDENRPLNLAEKFSELYDNEWTDLFDELCEIGKSEEDAISYLLDILKSISDYCNRASDLQQENLLKNFGINAYVSSELSKIHQETDTADDKRTSDDTSVCTVVSDQTVKGDGNKANTCTNQEVTTHEDQKASYDGHAVKTDDKESKGFRNGNADSDDKLQTCNEDVDRENEVKVRKQRQKVKRFLKSTRSFSLDVVKKQMIAEKLLPKEFTEKSSAYKQYFNKCTRLCWLMQMQEKPVVLVFEFTREAPYSTDFYRHYTKTGTKGDFLVWPAMLLHDGGPLLQKGVIQPL